MSLDLFDEAVFLLHKADQELSARGAKLTHAYRARVRTFIREKISDEQLARVCSWRGKPLKSMSGEELQIAAGVIRQRQTEHDEDIARGINHLLRLGR